jgi:hypothetical protein
MRVKINNILIVLMSSSYQVLKWLQIDDHFGIYCSALKLQNRMYCYFGRFCKVLSWLKLVIYRISLLEIIILRNNYDAREGFDATYPTTDQ